MAVTLDTLVIEYEIRNKHLKSQLRASERAVQRSTKKQEKAFQGLSAAATKGFAGMAAALTAAIGVSTLKNIVKLSDEIVRLNARLNATTGSAENAAEAMAFLKKTAKEQSIDLLALGDAYTRLLPSVQTNIITMAEMRTIMKLTNANIKALGLSGNEVKAIYLGLSQALGSGTVTMEDLRQVTDRLPGVLNVMAKSTGKSVNEFKKLIATGKITADMIKGPLIEAMKRNEGAAIKMAGTAESTEVRMDNSFRRLAAALGKSGVDTVYIKTKESLTELMDTVSDFIAQSDNLGKTLLRMYIYPLQVLRRLAPETAKSFEEFVGLIKKESDPLKTSLVISADKMGDLAIGTDIVKDHVQELTDKNYKLATSFDSAATSADRYAAAAAAAAAAAISDPEAEDPAGTFDIMTGKSSMNTASGPRRDLTIGDDRGFSVNNPLASILAPQSNAPAFAVEPVDTSLLNPEPDLNIPSPMTRPESVEDQAEEFQRRKDALENLIESQMTEKQVIDAWYKEQKTTLKEAKESELLLAWHYNDKMELLNKEHKRRLAKIEKDGEKTTLTAMIKGFAARAQALGIGGKKLFQIQKASALAQGVLDMRGSVMAAFNWGSKLGGPVGGALAAAAAGAAQLAQLNAIRSASYGGGGGSSAGGGGGGGGASMAAATTQPQAQEQAQAPQDININVSGFGGDEVLRPSDIRVILDQINDAISDGARINSIGLA